MKEGDFNENYEPLVHAVKRGLASKKPEPLPSDYDVERLLPPAGA